MLEVPTRPPNSDKRLTSALTSGTKEKSPLSFEQQAFLISFGVTDGARTHDNRNHNPDLKPFARVD